MHNRVPDYVRVLWLEIGAAFDPSKLLAIERRTIMQSPRRVVFTDVCTSIRIHFYLDKNTPRFTLYMFALNAIMSVDIGLCLFVRGLAPLD